MRRTLIAISSAVLLLALGVVIPLTLKPSDAVLGILWFVVVACLVVVSVLGTPLRKKLARFLSQEFEEVESLGPNVTITGGNTFLGAAPPTSGPASSAHSPTALPPVEPGYTRVFVADLVRDFGTHIVNRRFENVELVGPAVIALVGAVVLQTGHVAPGAEIGDSFFEFPPDRKVWIGLVVFQNCEFVNVRYLGIAWAGPPEMIALLRRGFSGESVHVVDGKEV